MRTVSASDLFLSSTLIVALVIYLCSKPPKWQRIATLIIGLAISLVCAGLAPGYVQVMLFLSYWSLACILLRLALPFFVTEQDRSLTSRMLLTPATQIKS
jgi:hypothetical protein